MSGEIRPTAYTSRPEGPDGRPAAATVRAADAGSCPDPLYTSGAYFQNPAYYEPDAPFKAQHFLDLFMPATRTWGMHGIDSFADVGCGGGRAADTIARTLRASGHPLRRAHAYDVSPHVRQLHSDQVEFVHGTFGACGEYAELVTMFDVVEHVADPVGLLRRVASCCAILALHIPLDRSLHNALRDRYRRFLRHPGHLIVLDVADALNLLALAGLRTIEYCYTPGYLAPSNRSTALARAIAPLRGALARLSPWLLSKTLGGVSLMVLTLTPAGLQKYGHAVSLPPSD